MEDLKQGTEHTVIDFDRAVHSQARPPWCRVKQGRAEQGRAGQGQGKGRAQSGHGKGNAQHTQCLL